MSSPKQRREPLKKSITVRLTQADYDLFFSMYRNSNSVGGISVSDFVRSAILQKEIAIPKIPKKNKIENTDCEKEKIRIIANFGNNINQIAKFANIALKQNDPEMFFEVLKKLETIYMYVEKEIEKK